MSLIAGESSTTELNILLESIKPIESAYFRKIEPTPTTTIGDTSLEYLNTLEIIICKKCGIFIYPTINSTLKHLKVYINPKVNL